MIALVEAVGSLAWGTLLPYLRAIATRVIGLDISPLAYGLYLVDRGYLVPRYSDPDCMDALLDICRRERVELVLPTLHEGLQEWAARRDELAREGIRVLISPPETIALCHDKWETYRFFTNHQIPTPRTSLQHEHDLIKPRVGRGGGGIRRVTPGAPVDMAGHVSQEFIEGQEFSVDALCDLGGRVLYVVPRKRLAVESGLSVQGQVVRDEEIETYVRRILSATPFVGPVDIQCFRTTAGVFFTEINPRIAGGLSLSMAATENWFEVLGKLFRGEKVIPKPVRYDLVMMRYYSDYIVPNDGLLK
jgi:carbamoyl-phosphate synthase large subunit